MVVSVRGNRLNGSLKGAGRKGQRDDYIGVRGKEVGHDRA
jgi:hypothetical protein